MAIVVIESGIKEAVTNTRYQHNCIVCGCIFSYLTEDIDLRTFCVACPECNTRIRHMEATAHGSAVEHGLPREHGVV